MTYLLDSHILLWTLFDDGRLKDSIRKTILDGENIISVSSTTFFELSLKFSLGKLELQGITPEKLPELCEQSGFEIIEPTVEVYATFHQLKKLNHKDSFDRLLIWQAIKEKYTLISRDREFLPYRKLGLQLLQN